MGREDAEVTIRIRYISKEIEKLRYVDGRSDWIDLRCAKETVLKQGETALIPLGVAMELPEGYEAHVDNDEWCFPVIALRDTVIHVNDRIAQFRIEKHQPRISFAETEHLSGEDRGGFGTTGIQ